MVGWLTFSQLSGYGRTDITITASSYTELVDRVTSILVSGVTASTAVTISQGENIFTITPTGTTVGQYSGTTTVEVYSKYNNWSVSGGTSYSSISQTTGGTGTTVITISYEQLPSTVNTRNVHYYFTDGDNELRYVLTQASTLSVNPRNITIPNTGGSDTFNVTATTSAWTVSSVIGNWFSYSPSSGGANTVLTVTVSANANSSYTTNREGSITISNGSRSIQVSVSQPAKTATGVIYYKSSNGNIVVPTNANAFGATLVDNQYVNGQGMLFFDSTPTQIGYQAFNDKSALTEITIPSSVTYIGSQAFSYTSLGAVTIPSGTTDIAEYAFASCHSLSSVTISRTVTRIGGGAFQYCENLASISFPSNSQLTELGYSGSAGSGGGGVFAYDSRLSSFSLPSGVTTLKHDMFTRCFALSTVTLPSTLQSIEDNAFFYTSGFTNMYCYARTAPSISSNAFFACGYPSGGTIHYPVGSNYSTWTSNTYLNTYHWTFVQDL